MDERNRLPEQTRAADLTGAPDSLPVLAEPMPRDRHPVAVYLASLSASGRRTMAQALGHCAGLLSGGAADAESLDWSRVRYQHVAALRTLLVEEGKRAATVNKELCAVRRVLRECWRLGLMTAEDYHRCADVEGVKARTVPKGRMLTADEVARLKDVCDPSAPAGVRDCAMLGLLARGGLRRAEAVALDVGDFTDGPEGGTLLVRAGKGNKERLVPVANGTLQAVRDWIAVRGDEPGPLLLPTKKGGKVEHRRMTAHAVYLRLQFLAKRAGVLDFTPHDLRRTAGSEMLDAGADLSVVADLLGHSSVDVTRRSYDRRGERAARRAASLVRF
ncbi:MAG: tyrosine-type recombinase/integrase [Planctomycetota bacterium]